MTKRLRRIRSAFLTGLTWAFAWSFIGTIFMVLLGVDLRTTTNMINPYSAMGLIGGAAFYLSRRRFDEMSLPRFAAWGAVGGVLLSMPLWGTLSSTLGKDSLAINLVLDVAQVGVMALMCAGCAAGSLALARNAHDGDLLEAGGSAEKIEGE